MSHTFTSITHSIMDDISALGTHDPVLIYIGVGTFAGLMSHRINDNDKQERFLEPQNYHQYPPFIRHLKKTIPNLNLYTILIDPMQENPPHMIRDGKYTGEEFYQEKQDTYVTYDDKFRVYVLRKNVTIREAHQRWHANEGVIDITSDLIELNKFCMKNHVSMFYHDFSGRDVKSVAEYFDPQLGKHVDTIVYGFGARADFGCYFDLTAGHSSYPYIIKQKPKRHSLSFFNMYKYINTGEYYKLEMDKEKYGNQNLINAQLDEYKKALAEEFRSYSLSVLRMFHRLINGLSTDINEYFLNRIKSSHRGEFEYLYRLQNYHVLFEKLIDYYSIEMDIYSKIKNFDVSGKEIIQILISGENPYNWASELRTFDL
jgi:hypothetical protein